MKRGEPLVPASAGTAARRWARKAAAVSVGVALAFGALPDVAAHADGRVTWRNLPYKRYLEVYQSSKKKGALVGAWPWNGTKTQYWYDEKLSDRYYVEFNYNSLLLLTAYNNCGSGVTQWPSNGRYAYTTQEWKEKHLSSDEGWVLINKAGCGGSGYNDILATSATDFNLYNVYLYSEKSGPCSLVMWPTMGPQSQCLWK
ncbi:RICIN domain-containing protein [Sphaerisporangium fuscum]|uniref:RICIN domain-containing protein n=1 Tax=Sphaerisporangium fuscum TaxID=2835868 RepID=UPI001BDC7EB9|nr:RICIN domain-containing protein [Sphaerisporangium fuscum]